MIYEEEVLAMGINAPKEHQKVIANLITGLNTLYKQGKISLEPYPETMLDAGRTSPVPDVLLYDNDRTETVVIIEVAHSDGIKHDFTKVQELIQQGFYGIREGFVYDYKNARWRKYQSDKGEVTQNPSFCESIGLDLEAFVR